MGRELTQGLQGLLFNKPLPRHPVVKVGSSLTSSSLSVLILADDVYCSYLNRPIKLTQKKYNQTKKFAANIQRLVFTKL